MPVSEFAFPGMSGYGIDNVALELIKRIQPEVLAGKCSFDVERYVDVYLEEMTGIAPDYRQGLPDGIYGYTHTAEGRMVINSDLLDNMFGDNERFYRSTVAHEVGHCILHVPVLRQQKRDKIFTENKKEEKIALYRKTNIPLYQNPEWQAWRFAGALLMPANVMRALIAEGASIQEMANHFHVNGSFVESRMRALRIST